MSSVSISKSSYTENDGTIATSKYNEEEVREYRYGFHSGLTQNTEGLYSNLGNCR